MPDIKDDMQGYHVISKGLPGQLAEAPPGHRWKNLKYQIRTLEIAISQQCD